jgi:hypothetical protein
MMKAFRSPTINRVLFGLICLIVVLTGAGNLLQGRLGYQNYKGFSVFAPFAILVGALGLVIAILRPAFFASEKGHRRNRTRTSKPASSTRKLQ